MTVQTTISPFYRLTHILTVIYTSVYTSVTIYLNVNPPKARYVNIRTKYKLFKNQKKALYQ